MKKFIFAFMLFSLIGCWDKTPPKSNTTPFPFTPGTQFPQTNLDKALAQAKQENKFVYLFLTEDGCVYCNRMKKSVFPQVDMSRVVFVESKDVNLHQKFQAPAFPTSILLDSNGKELKREVGFMSAHELKLWLP